MGKWIDLANAQANIRTAKNTKAVPPAPPPPPDARIAYLESRVAALEARVQWSIDVIQQMAAELERVQKGPRAE